MQIRILVCLGAVFLASGCTTPRLLPVDYSGRTMGTSYRVTYGIGKPELAVDQAGIDSLLAEINRSLSPYEPGSLISRINRSRDVSEVHEIDRHFDQVFQHAKRVHTLTGGAFNPALGPLIRAWGFSVDEPRLLDSLEVQELLSISDFGTFSLQTDSSATTVSTRSTS